MGVWDIVESLCDLGAEEGRVWGRDVTSQKRIRVNSNLGNALLRYASVGFNASPKVVVILLAALLGMGN